MWTALLILIIVTGAAGIVFRSRNEKASARNVADAFDIIEDV
jgi:hypothetical protein